MTASEKEKQQERLSNLITTSADLVQCLSQTEAEIKHVTADLKKPTTEEKAEKARKRLANALNPESKEGLDDSDAITLAEFVTIMEDNRGCDTPIESFIIDLVEHYRWHRRGIVGRTTTTYRLTPKEIESQLEDLKANFRDAIRIARKYSSEYPELMEEDEDERE